MGGSVDYFGVSWLLGSALNNHRPKMGVQPPPPPPPPVVPLPGPQKPPTIDLAKLCELMVQGGKKTQAEVIELQKLIVSSPPPLREKFIKDLIEWLQPEAVGKVGVQHGEYNQEYSPVRPSSPADRWLKEYDDANE